MELCVLCSIFSRSRVNALSYFHINKEKNWRVHYKWERYWNGLLFLPVIAMKTGHSSSARNSIASCGCNPTKIAGGSMVIWRRQWHPTPVLLPGKSHGWTSPVGCSPWSRSESDRTEQLHFHFHFSPSCIGEGNGNPLQYSCLENPRDGEPGGLPSMGSHRVGHDWSD